MEAKGIQYNTTLLSLCREICFLIGDIEGNREVNGIGAKGIGGGKEVGEIGGEGNREKGRHGGGGG